MKNKISLIITAKNEVQTISRVIKKSQRQADEILVIDGHSDDGTRKQAEALGVKVILDQGKGKGAA